MGFSFIKALNSINEREASQKEYNFITDTPAPSPNIIDISPAISANQTGNYSQIRFDPLVPQYQEPSYMRDSLAAQVGKNYIAAVSGFGESASMGALPLLLNKQQPQQYQEMRKTQQENPIASTVGNIAGYIVPGAMMTKGLSTLPTLGKLYPTLADSAMSFIGKSAVTGMGEGLLQGAVEGGFESIRDNKPMLQTVADRAQTSGLMGGAFGALLGGAAKGISRGLEVNSFKPIMKDLEQYKVPELNVPTSILTPEQIRAKETSLPKFSAEIPAKYLPKSKPTVKTNEPLLLGEGTNKTLPKATNIQPKPLETNAQNKPFNTPKSEGNINSPSAKINPVNESLNVPQTKSKYTPEVQTKLDELDAKHKQYKSTINSLVNRGLKFRDEADKMIKGSAMKTSAQKREIIQGDSLIPVDGGLTEKELYAKIQKLKSNYRGKVDIDAEIERQYKALNTPKVESNIQTPSPKNEAVKTPINANAKVEYSNTLTPEVPKVAPKVEPTVAKNTTVEANATKNKTSKFGTNTYARATQISEETKAATPESVFGYKTETKKQWQDSAIKNVQNDFDGTMKKLISKEEFNAVDHHEAAIIAKHLEQEAKATGDMSKYLNFMENAATKGASQSGKSLKAVDTAWEKSPTANKAIMEAQKGASKAEEVLKKENPKKYNNYKNDVKKYQKAVQDAVDKTSSTTMAEIIRDLKGAFGNLCD
jgi:hypothetical protein